MNTQEWVINQVRKIDFKKKFVEDSQSGTSYSYEEFFKCVLCINNYLDTNCEAQKIIPVLENSMELFMLYFCCMLGNRVIVPIDPQKGTEEIEKLVKQTRDDAIVVYSQQDEIFRVNIYDEELNLEKSIQEIVVDKLANTNFEKEYLISFTSGTSGNSKGVKHSLNDMFSTIRAFDSVHPIKNGRVFGHLFPMTYMAGILNSILKPFIFADEIIILGRFDVKMALKFWSTIEKYNISLLWLNPTMLNMIYNTDRGNKGKGYCEKNEMQIFVGTAPLTNQLKTMFEDKYGVNLYVSYGLTELLFLSVDTDMTHGINDGNVGEILPGVKFANPSGEALVDVDWMFSGYVNENTADYFEGDFYKTGDLIEIVDKQLYIVGRKKNLIIKGGMNISPVSIENEILKLEQIKDVAVFGERSSNEEKIVCVYVLSGMVCEKDIQKIINQILYDKLGKAYTIDEFYVTKELVCNINGKKDIEKIKESIRKKTCS